MKLRKIIRHSYVSVLFIMGLAVSCFVLINVSELVSNMLQDYLHLHEYKFEKCLTLSYEDDSATTLDALACAQKITAGNIYVYFPVEINKSLNQYVIRVFIKNNEETGLSYTPLDNAGENTSKENGVLIGHSLKSQILEDSNGSYIELNGVRISVLGVLDNNMAGGTNCSIYLFWQDCSQELRNKLLYYMEREYCFYFASHEPALEEYAQFVSSLESIGFTALEFEPYYSGDVENAWYEMYQGFFLPLCLLFSLCNCFVVSHVWFLYRKKEIAVRKAYGYSNVQIALLFGKDITILTLLGFAIAIIIQIIYSLFAGISMVGQQIWWKIGLVFLGTAGLVLVNLLFVLLKLRKLQPVKLITE